MILIGAISITGGGGDSEGCSVEVAMDILWLGEDGVNDLVLEGCLGYCSFEVTELLLSVQTLP